LLLLCSTLWHLVMEEHAAFVSRVKGRRVSCCSLQLWVWRLRVATQCWRPQRLLLLLLLLQNRQMHKYRQMDIYIHTDLRTGTHTHTHTHIYIYIYNQTDNQTLFYTLHMADKRNLPSTSGSQPLSHAATPTIFHIPENLQLWRRLEFRKIDSGDWNPAAATLLYRKELLNVRACLCTHVRKVTLLSSNDFPVFPRTFRILRGISKFHNFYAYIPQFLAGPLNMFYKTIVR